MGGTVPWIGSYMVGTVPWRDGSMVEKFHGWDSFM